MTVHTVDSTGSARHPYVVCTYSIVQYICLQIYQHYQHYQQLLDEGVCLISLVNC
jgi:hypothetical protein